MRISRRYMLLAAAVALVGGIAACGDDDPAAPAPDRTPPTVVSNQPGDGATDVALTDSVIVVFDEDMAAATADGQVTFSHGAATTTAWLDGRQLAVLHEPWPPATEVTVTLGTSLTDAAGNALAQAHEFAFTTGVAPQVSVTTPRDGLVDVAADASLTVTFDRPMDPASSAGQVTLSTGAVLALSWVSDRRLVVDHTNWVAGAKVTVTLGTGLAATDGHTLVAPYEFAFWTASPGTFKLLEATPADGATDINRDVVIRLQFSEYVDLPEFYNTVTISDGARKTDLAYLPSQTAKGLVLLDPDESLPANTAISVTLPASLPAMGGGPTLGVETVVTFTTGDEVDLTTPTVVAASPINGARDMAPDAGAFSITFSEPVDPDSAQPISYNLNYFIETEFPVTTPPYWNDDGTVMTQPLPTGLPPGMPIEVVFADFADLVGNVQTSPYTYSIRVAGEADFVPVVNGMVYIEEAATGSGPEGSTEPTTTQDLLWLVGQEVQPDGSFRMVQYDYPDLLSPTGQWEAFRKTAGALQWVGLTSVEQTYLKAEDLSMALTYLPLPVAAGTWPAETATIDIPGEDLFRITVSGNVIGRGDVDLGGQWEDIFLKDAWQVQRQVMVEVFATGAFEEIWTKDETAWYAVARGEVLVTGRTVDSDGDWIEVRTVRVPLGVPPKSGWERLLRR